MLAMIRLPNTFIRLVPEGGWFDVPGGGQASPAQSGPVGTTPTGSYALVPLVPAASPPAGKIHVGAPSYTVAGGTCTETYQIADVPITVEDVIAERDRRMALGFDYDFGDARGVHRIGTTAADMKGWDEVTSISQAALALGNASLGIQIVTDTGPATVTATEWQAILLAAGAHRQPIWAASFVLQASYPIPADYADDSHWPPA